MQSHRRRRRRRLRAVVLGLAACAAVAAPAGAVPADDRSMHSAPTIKTGDTPADFAQPVTAPPRAGDTPVDHPGASRASDYSAPMTIEVVRPERTIVRDVDEVLPIVLSSVALLVALGGCAFLLAGRIRGGRLRSSH